MNPIPRHAGRAITSLLPALLAMALIAACAPVRADAPLLATPIALDGRAPERVRFGELDLLAAFELTQARNPFGGFSGLVVSPDGARLLALSDRASWLEVALVHDGDGRLTGFGTNRLVPLLDTDGAPMAGFGSDAEALTVLPEGGYAVSFEGVPRIDAYPDGPDGPARPLVRRGTFGDLERNGGLEAMAAFRGGFLALVEEAAADGLHAGFLIGPGGEVATLRYEAAPAFKPTDLAVLADGDVLVLERKYNVVEGAHARLVRVAAETIAPGAILAGRELLRLAPPLATDNFEGLAVRPAPGGGTLVYVISDDNFKPYQRTLLLQFRLSD